MAAAAANGTVSVDDEDLERGGDVGRHDEPRLRVVMLASALPPDRQPDGPRRALAQAANAADRLCVRAGTWLAKVPLARVAFACYMVSVPDLATHIPTRVRLPALPCPAICLGHMTARTNSGPICRVLGLFADSGSYLRVLRG